MGECVCIGFVFAERCHIFKLMLQRYFLKLSGLLRHAQIELLYRLFSVVLLAILNTYLKYQEHVWTEASETP